MEIAGGVGAAGTSKGEHEHRVGGSWPVTAGEIPKAWRWRCELF